MVEHAQRHELNTNDNQVEDLDAFLYLEHVEHIADPEFQSPPPLLPCMETYSSASALLSDYTAELWEYDTQGCLEMNIQNNPYYPFATCEEFKYIQYAIKKKGMQMCYYNQVKEEYTEVDYPSFINGNGVYKVVGSMPDDQAFGEWKLHTLKNMRCHDNHECPLKYWSREIIKSMR